MTILTSEIADNLLSIEGIKAFLAGLITAASDNRNGEPVRLTYVGGEFAKAVGMPFEKHVAAIADLGQVVVPRTQRKLAPFVQAYCKDILALTEISGVYFVSPHGLVGDHSVRSTASRVPATLRFHRAVWTAFIRPLDGRRRFLNLDKIGFTDTADSPVEGNWHEINERFILGLTPNAPVDGVELQTRIEQWANEAGISLSQLIMGPKPPREVSRKIDQLFEIIDSLPAPLAASWLIPAALLKHLRDER